ncbi:hypothetical protein [Clostridium sp.]|uniref:hypothetical protein n=1 Tax=Clostridium sp. TaxID=1506 RepID=UPI001A62EB71|nr:hypothetical protein [Clostridium sp.]MBK5237140.1 hypothetical protein [Clostridium sp.]
MKWMKRISIWIVFSLSMQCLGLFYINHYFLATDSKVVTKKVVEDKSEKIKNIDITVPANAENVLVSYDAKYLTYFENEKLKIVNSEDGKNKNIEAEEGCKISFSEWLPDRNRILLVERKADDESSNLVLYSYDVSKGVKVKIKDLAWADAQAEVEDVQTAPLTGLIYVKVSSNGGKSSIYRIERMKDMTKINTIPQFVSNISLLLHDDKLVYEGLVYNSIYITGKYEAISIEGVDKLTLIGADGDDNVYLGELKDNLVTKIYFGKISENTSEWKSVTLEIPCKKSDLFISNVGKAYQSDTLRGVVKEINSGTETSYQGKLVQLYTKGIVVLVDNKISFVPFK